MSDPGIQLEDDGTRMLAGKNYRALKVRFVDGVGDASDDEYLLLANPETGRMEWLLYTVTYFSQERTNNYNALKYDDWFRTGGLILPGSLTGYRYENDSLGAQRYQRIFSRVSFSDEAYEDAYFKKPEDAIYVMD